MQSTVAGTLTNSASSCSMLKINKTSNAMWFSRKSRWSSAHASSASTRSICSLQSPTGRGCIRNRFAKSKRTSIVWSRGSTAVKSLRQMTASSLEMWSQAWRSSWRISKTISASLSKNLPLETKKMLCLKSRLEAYKSTRTKASSELSMNRESPNWWKKQRIRKSTMSCRLLKSTRKIR